MMIYDFHQSESIVEKRKKINAGYQHIIILLFAKHHPKASSTECFLLKHVRKAVGGFGNKVVLVLM